MVKLLPTNLPVNLTSYDFLKALAVILMIVDHVGYHFYPDEEWFRVLGRLCVPMWFFLIGYARTRDIPKILWIGAVIVVASALMAGQYLFPLNILVTLGLTRFLIDGIMRRAVRSHETLAGMFFLLLFLSIPAGLFFEYGTLGMLFAVLGYLSRNRDRIPFGRGTIVFFSVFAGLIFIISQGAGMASLSGVQGAVLFFGVYGVLAGLWRFRPAEYPKLTSALPKPLTWMIQLLGRRTLEIYVFHLVLFRAIGMALNPQRFAAFEAHLMPESALAFIKSILGLQ